MPPILKAGFTLLELSVVILILALLAAAALRYAAAIKDAKNLSALNTSLDTVETTLLNYRIAYGRLPCPADLTLAETSSSFGAETDTLGDGQCTGYRFINSGTDPDGLSADVNTVVAGALPTRALGLSDKYAYDSWGRKILYAVDIRMTAQNAFLTYPSTTSGTTNPGVIEIKYAVGDSASHAITTNAVYALVSFGEDGHGSWVRNLTNSIAITTRYSSGSNNLDELQNCHCTNTATAGTFDRIFIQKAKTNGSSGSLTYGFDDVVRFKTRAELSTSTELQ